MADNLVIVESPAKAGTIGKYLGKDFQVIASMGHIRDLPASKLGVDVDTSFTPQYVIPTKARKTVTSLKKALIGKKTVYLAPDLDREGEAIAWHIKEALDLSNNKDIKVHRITFDEITKTAILKAIENPRDIDIDLVDAQQTRRVLDRLVGYTLSPILWKKVYKGLSAGRVQSAALRIIVDREREREAFQPVEYWTLKADLLQKEVVDAFTASISTYNGTKLEQLSIADEKTAQEMTEAVQKAVFTVTGLESKEVRRKPSAPYTTSSFQQDAVNKLGMSAKNAMRAAQKLYEAGFITYMRTDSVDLAQEALTAIRGYIGSEFGANYLPGTPNTYTSKKSAQEAHEAIRPTDITRIEASADATFQKVYELIRRRALASQMVPAVMEQVAAVITAGPATFRATGQRVVFPGFLAASGDEKEDTLLPAMKEGEVLSLKELHTEQHFTEPPPRYSEATIIKALEEMGIGRPSTYAPTIATLVERTYIRVEQRRIIPEDVAKIVIDLLKENFPEIIDLTFTASMEEQLDEVAGGKRTYTDLLTEFWGPFHKQVEEKSEKIEKVHTDEETDIPCPNCGTMMIKKRGRFGVFLACPKYPECKTTMPVAPAVSTGLVCPICGKDLAEKKSRRGMFFGCTGYPTCTFALWKREQFPAKIEELEKAGTELPFKEQAVAAFNTAPPVNVSEAS
jgi:DNA topoisomerase-1